MLSKRSDDVLDTKKHAYYVYATKIYLVCQKKNLSYSNLMRGGTFSCCVKLRMLDGDRL